MILAGNFIEYESTNKYPVYNPHTGKIHIICDLFVDDQQLYHRKAFNDEDYSKDDWIKSDDAQFADITNFEDTKDASLLLLENSFHSVGDNTPKQPKKKSNDCQNSD